MFKFNLGQVIYYLKNNKVHSASVLSRCYVDNVKANPSNSKANFENRFGATRKHYATCHGEFNEVDAFGSLEDLKNSI